MNARKAIEMVMKRIVRNMHSAENIYANTVNTTEWQYWEGKWRGIADCYDIAVKVLAEVLKEEEE